MKRIPNILKCFMIIVISVISVNFKYTGSFADSNNSSYVVIEKLSGRVLYEYNSNKKAYMASTTKILTAITVIDNFDISREVTVPKSCVGVEGSSVYLNENDVFTVEDLLYGLMLRSGNDCAEALAITLSGSIEDFASLMNQTAIRCGATNSNFKNPHGLHDDNHYTTAYDLALITRYALKNSVFAKIASTKNYVATEKNSNVSRYWINKNKMLSSFEGATGVKTGFTKKAGRCLVSSAQKNGMELICVVLNEPNHYQMSKNLLTKGFDNYRLIKIIDANKFDYSLPTENRTEYYDLEVKDDFYYPVSNGESISAEIALPKYLPSSVKSGEKVGEIKIYASKQLIFLQNIYT
ncbi:MAG: D-alanyl-D-alanine carboxypeptidase [Clostridia bacterium]|nr:D-alanyl-D-alanine carboxypeptidase [Clostridia bacterium]